MRLRLILVTFVLVLLLTACPNPAGGTDPNPGEEDDPVLPQDLPSIPEDATPSDGGAGDFLALIVDTADNAVSLVRSSASEPSQLEIIIDGDISSSTPYVRISPDASAVAYLNVSNQLIWLETDSTRSYVVRTYTIGAENTDEFWWYDDDTLLFSSDASLSRAAIVDSIVESSEIIGGEICHHDLALNPYAAVGSGRTVALTYVNSDSHGTIATVFTGDYVDTGDAGQINNTSAIVSHSDEFDIGFDPMLTWLSSDVLVWRTDLAVSTLWYCNVTDYLAHTDPSSLGRVGIEMENAPTKFLLSLDGSCIYLYGNGKAVSRAAVPTEVDDYDAEVFYVDDIEFTISKLEFSPSGNYFLVGNRSRLRCFATDDPAQRFSWWEDTSLETQLNAGERELLEIWWM
jgi:hypothetical protein